MPFEYLKLDSLIIIISKLESEVRGMKNKHREIKTKHTNENKTGY